MNEFRRDTKKWNEVSRSFVIGAWSHKFELLWSEVPVYYHFLGNGTGVKYGYSRNQHENYPDRELWYISFEGNHTFIVDKVCTEIEFINTLGTDFEGWTAICWCYLTHFEQEWDDIGERQLGYIYSPSFALDSPYRPKSISEIYEFISDWKFDRKKALKKRGYGRY